MLRYRRRQALHDGIRLAAALTLAAGCVPPGGVRTLTVAELYVGLARERAVAVLDSITDRVISRISLSPLGRQGLPWQIGVGPTGNAAVLPLVANAPEVGVIRPAGAAGGDAPSVPITGSPSRRNLPAGARLAPLGAADGCCERVRVGTGASLPHRYGAGESAQHLTADARGRAYVLVVDPAGLEPSTVAVLDLATGTILRHLPVAQAGEQVLALEVLPDGSRLYASVWRSDWLGRPGWGPGAGRIVALDPAQGRLLAQTSLPDGNGAMHLAVAPALGAGHAPTLYGALSTPSFWDDGWGWALPRPPLLVAMDALQLDPLSVWSLEERPAALAVHPEGRHAYLLMGQPLAGTSSRRLVCLDLGAGVVTQRWPLPGGCLALAMGPVDKLYVADTLGDRLWRVDTRSNTLLAPIALQGAPLALAARPA
jgi:hypothetical protein